VTAPSFHIKTYDQLLEDYTRERGSHEHEPVRLGFGSLDADMRGISAGQVCGIAARTGVGKTWLLAAIEQHFAARGDAGSLVLSLEMPDIEWAERALAIHADVSPEQVEEWARDKALGSYAGEFLERMRNARILDERIRLQEMPIAVAQARKQLDPVPLRLLLIDYLGLIDVQGRDAYERASQLGRELKTFAKQAKVAVVVAMQLSRAAGDGSQPVTADMLRDSGVLEESLDFLLGAWRPEKNPDLKPLDYYAVKDVLRVCLLKNRKGQDGRVVDLRFQPASRRIHEDASPFAEAA
jgi:replicative DNA helicase